MSEITRLTIVVADRAVYKNREGYSDLDFSGCGIPEDVWVFQWENGEGWIEFKDSRENEPVSGSDFPEWVIKCTQKFDEFDELFKNPPPLTPEQIVQMNKFESKQRLLDSDWVALQDVSLQNQNEWDAYRASLRGIFLNPPQEEITWPEPPEVIWS